MRISTIWLKTNGNIGAVVKAILLDPEARKASFAATTEYGRLKDPIQRLTNLLIGFNCGSKLGKNATDYPGLQWWRPDPFKHLLQAPMQAPSVFNFFDSEYSKPGQISAAQLYSPEFQILNDATASTFPNYIWRGLLGGFHKPNSSDQASLPLICPMDSIGNNSIREILRKSNIVLAAGTVNQETLTAIEALIKTQIKNGEAAAIFAIAISPNATVQR